MMKKRLPAILAIVSLVVLTAIITSACGNSDDTKTTELGPVEIREYQGEKLSSVDDFRENSIGGPQYIDIEKYTLDIGGLVETPLSLTYNQVLEKYQSYEKVVTLSCVEGWSAKILWEGLLLKDIISDAGPLPEVRTVILFAYDGYSTSFPIEYIMDNDILIAYKMNEIDLPPERGYPFALVAESKWGYKWIKWITDIELSDRTDYEGYWESRGYSNDADLGRSFFD
ncbi:MAG: molybdopterin-dependent oxidoreductase [Dehalococcoidales bacterium]|nr:molybdopterin-dependent oxidoreductase [Dehalococcoidales bacterium]